MLPVVFAVTLVGGVLLGRHLAVRRVGSDFANRQWGKAAVAGAVGLAIAIVARSAGVPISFRNLELPALVLGTGVEVAALMRRWNRGRLGAPVVNMAGDPLRKGLRSTGLFMLVGAALLTVATLMEGEYSTLDLVRRLFLGTSGLLFLAKARPTPELFERGIIRLEGMLPWDRVSAYSWQEFEKVTVLRLQLREPWRFQRRLSFTIPASEQAALHAWLQRRLPYLGSERGIEGARARLRG